MDLEKIYNLCEEIIEINKKRSIELKYEIDNIISNKIKDKMVIERKLDELLEILSFSEVEGTLLTFKKLCRYYYNIDREATIDYINFCIEDRKKEEIER